MIKDIKLSTSKVIKNERLFPLFDGWQEGYGAFTYAIEAKENLVAYIMNQETLHQNLSYEAEFRKLLEEFKIEFKEEYLF